MPKPEITCKLTGTIGPAIGAHVIPRSLYKFNGDGKIIVTGEDYYRENRSPLGIYDQTIVTKEGEAHFQDCDAYGADFFIKNWDTHPWQILPGENPLKPRGKVLSPTHFDAGLIRRLCMTILWRAHVSSQQFFKHVNLGPHEERLRQHILDGTTGDPSDFSIILSTWNDTRSAPTFMPGRTRVDGLNYYHFKTSAFNFMIKVDGQPFEKELLPVVVGGDPYLSVLQISFFNTKEAKTFIPLLRKHQQ